MLTVGLTGGIASGKSTVAAMFEQLGAYLIDTDQLARQVVNPGQAALAEIVSVFGSHVLLASGELDRAKLGAMVFGDPSLLAKLNAILHPPIRALMFQEAEEARKRGAKIVLLEVPLLFETGFDKDVDFVIVVTATREEQQRRLMARNNFTAEEAQKRMAAQIPPAEKTARAHYIVNNSGSLKETRAQVEKVWLQLRQELLK